jgi:hypothetical protein
MVVTTAVCRRPLLPTYSSIALAQFSMPWDIDCEELTPTLGPSDRVPYGWYGGSRSGRALGRVNLL